VKAEPVLRYQLSNQTWLRFGANEQRFTETTLLCDSATALTSQISTELVLRSVNLPCSSICREFREEDAIVLTVVRSMWEEYSPATTGSQE